jgi:multiple sugar transport system substrate-binding protein
MIPLTSKRSLLLLVVLAALSVALSACAGRGDAAPPAAGSPNVARKGTAPADAPVSDAARIASDGATAPVARKVSANDVGVLRAAAAAGPILNPNVSGNIQFWHFWGSPVRQNAVRRVIALCEQKLPNIKIADKVVPFGDIWTANLAAVAAGSGMPDVIVSDRPHLQKDAVDGVYMSLQKWADRDNVNRDQFYPWSWDQAVYQGEVYGIPHETDVNVLFYNKNLFRQAGLDPERPPRTWAELAQYADKLDRIENGEIKRMAFFPLWNRGTDLWQYMNSATMMSPDGTLRINNPLMVQTVEWMKSWVDRYGGWERVQNFRSLFGAPPNDLFMSSRLAMYVDIFGYNSALQFYRPVVTLDNGKEERLEWGIALLPYRTTPGTSSGGFSLSIPNGAANPDAAWEFIKCATGAEAQASWARDTQAQPTNLMAARDPVLLADPAWQIVDQALRTSTGGYFVARYPNWAEQLAQRWELVWRGELTPQQMLDEAQAAVQAVLK